MINLSNNSHLISSKAVEKKKLVPSSSMLGIKRKSHPQDSADVDESGIKSAKTETKKPLISLNYASSSEEE